MPYHRGLELDIAGLPIQKQIVAGPIPPLALTGGSLYACVGLLRCRQDPGAKILIFIGRWVKQKGVDHIAMLTKDSCHTCQPRKGWEHIDSGVDAGVLTCEHPRGI